MSIYNVELSLLPNLYKAYYSTEPLVHRLDQDLPEVVSVRLLTVYNTNFIAFEKLDHSECTLISLLLWIGQYLLFAYPLAIMQDVSEKIRGSPGEQWWPEQSRRVVILLYSGFQGPVRVNILLYCYSSLHDILKTWSTVRLAGADLHQGMFIISKPGMFLLYPFSCLESRDFAVSDVLRLCHRS